MSPRDRVSVNGRLGYSQIREVAIATEGHVEYKGVRSKRRAVAGAALMERADAISQPRTEPGTWE